METEKTDDKHFKEFSNKKLDKIIEQSKAENEALKKLLTGLEKLEKTDEAETGNEKRKKKKNIKQELESFIKNYLL